MKPHEIIENVLLLVSSHFQVKWKYIIKDGTRNVARSIAMHYLHIYVGKDLAMETMNCTLNTLYSSGDTYRKNKNTLAILDRAIYIKVENKRAA